ncbi:hypothetical protein MUU74_07010 [Chryseobacterium daecheongense]|uniref:DUF6705 family protein n=1 Tax=Chryseobacterium daecheongense TaxID=192389 RepID=UPI001FD712C9|nr:DUF6705 family protein [Chryseobacterium daecheongense]UOU99698.1 hypothetical protein MUU74_07010 [Chryseobacterium daecheongense]
MKNNIIYIMLFIGLLSCKAQTISLDQLSQCENGPNCPDYLYLKDTNNRLNNFVGIWKGTYAEDGRTYEFHFTKKENDYSFGKYWDILIGRILVKKDNLEIANTLNSSDQDAMFSGFIFDKYLKKYEMYYSGNADCNDKGRVYISFPDPNNLNQMRLVFIQDMDIVENCPNGYKTVIPDAKILMLTKQ